MAKQLVKLKKNQLQKVLRTQELVGYFDDDEKDFHIVGSRFPTAEEEAEDNA